MARSPMRTFDSFRRKSQARIVLGFTFSIAAAICSARFSVLGGISETIRSGLIEAGKNASEEGACVMSLSKVSRALHLLRYCCLCFSHHSRARRCAFPICSSVRYCAIMSLTLAASLYSVAALSENHM